MRVRGTINAVTSVGGNQVVRLCFQDEFPRSIIMSTPVPDIDDWHGTAVIIELDENDQGCALTVDHEQKRGSTLRQ